MLKLSDLDGKTLLMYSTIGFAFSAALSIYEAASLVYNASNINTGINLVNNGKKAIVQTSLYSRSITEWTDNTFSYQYVNNSDVKIQSEVAMYADAK